ncbi:MAG TPA: hypothetical protein VJX10_07335 [Pseudonocardiaceae bacterium]|nr:hypothetical protein [Pseudonocardiaceae bacterium]
MPTRCRSIRTRQRNEPEHQAGHGALARLRVIAEQHEADITAGLTELCARAGLDVDVHARIAHSERKEHRDAALG